MRKVYSLLSLLVVLPLVSVFFISVSHAQTTNEKCIAAQNKLDTLSKSYDIAKTRISDSYSRSVSSLRDLATRLTARGYNTTQLTTDIQALQTKVDKFNANMGSLLTSVKNLKNIVCSDNFKTELSKTREQLVTVRSSMNDILNYYQTVIKGDIKDLKNQKIASITTTIPATPTPTVKITKKL